jgi:hypothetical protein
MKNHKMGLSGLEGRVRMTGESTLKRGCQTRGTRLFLFSLGIFVFCLAFMMEFPAREAGADPSSSAFTAEVKGAIEKLSASLIDPVSKKDVHAIQETLDKVILNAEREGKPIRFGVGILDHNGLAVAGRYIIGTFKVGDFSNYNFVVKAFKQKKIIQNRLYFQDQSDFLILCAPLVQQKKVIGAVVLGFSPSDIMKDYGITTEQFMAFNFNQ